MGRPKKGIDISTLDKLCEMHCTGAEIAGFFDVSYPTLLARIREQIKPDGTNYETFLEYFSARSSFGKISMRNMQWKSAEHGNVIMQQFLGKNLLDQTDKQTIDMNTVEEIHVIYHDPDDPDVDGQDDE